MRTDKLIKEAKEIEERIKFEEKKKETDKIIQLLRENYDLIIECLEDYMDLNESEQKIIAIWCLGAALHNCFDCFPYLYFNAMRGSGKTRLLKMITFFNKGNLTTAPTEAVLFRDKGLLALDEFERMDAKEKRLLKEMLNTAYKKGLYILRTIKRKKKEGEVYEIEKYETYRPVAMANIWGMDDVLGDRCISITLEKSNNPIKTKKMEKFDIDERMLKVRTNQNKCSLCSDVLSGDIKNITKNWNIYINNKYKTTLTTYNTYETQITQISLIEKIIIDKLFLKIDESGLNGRTLELFFPLFLIANFLGEEVLEETINFAKKINEERKATDAENKDVLLYKFVSELDSDLSWHSVKELTRQFKLFLGEEDEEWVNSRWFGRALKRLNLVNDRRRIGTGREVILNVIKAKEKIMMFKQKKDE